MKFAKWNQAIHSLQKNSPEFTYPGCFVFDSCSSTMDLGKSYLKNPGSLDAAKIISTKSRPQIWIFSYEQTQGRGRRNRIWESRDTGGMYFTLVDTCPRPLKDISGLSLVMGLAIQQALGSYELKVGLKWPNDVLISAPPFLKISGILIETQPTSDPLFCNIIVGVGVNINQEFFPDTVPATSIYLEKGVCQNYEATCLALARQLDVYYHEFFNKGFLAYRDKCWEASLMQDVLVTCENYGIDGKVVGIDAHGELLVKSGDTVNKIISGEVTPKFNLQCKAESS